jgi:hypothetical protein
MEFMTLGPLAVIFPAIGMDFMTQGALVLLFPALGMFVLYCVIRLGVRHGLRDVKNEEPPIR